MSLAATQPQPPAAELRLNETMQPEIFSGEIPLQKIPLQEIRLREIRLHDRQVWQAERLRLLWDHRQLAASCHHDWTGGLGACSRF